MHTRFALLTITALLTVGCAQSFKLTIVDIDNGYAPVPNASIARFKLPHRAGDPWPTTPAETQTTGTGGTTVFDNNSGRFVISAPGKAPASVFSTFAPASLEVGVSGNATAGK